MAKPQAPGQPLPALKMPLLSDTAHAGGVPGVLRSAGSRADGSDGEDLLPGLEVVRTLELAPASRSADAPASEVLDAGAGLLALEAADGTTIFIRADALAEQLARARPELIEIDEQQARTIDFARFRDNRDTARGALGWVWRRVMELRLPDDELAGKAREAAREALGGKTQDWAAAWASRKGAQALMRTIENRLAGTPGLYRWRGGALQDGDRCESGDARLSEAARAGSLLVFIHGTGSHTLGGFGDLPGSSAWGVLEQRFGERVFGFEHRTFSESPIDNALALADVLPAESRLCLVTHSRGGLVGDLMCLDAGDAMLDELIDAWRPAVRGDERATARELAAVATAEQAKLRRLAALLRDKKLRVERYVRVAAPARGTALLSDNLDVFLSTLLNLVRRFGAWGAGTVAGALASPLAAEAARKAANRGLAFLSRVVLEIADKRLQPGVVPGIEAMLPESPMGMLLGRAALAPQTRMAVIAGDIEGGGAGLVQRIGVMFVDWAFFDRARNDLVVDTDSMYGGLIARAAGAGGAAHRAIYVQGPEVSHFRYFRDDVKSAGVGLPAALAAWLTREAPERQAPWLPLALPELEPAAASRASRGEAEPADDTIPVLVYLPGIMGSHLAADGDRIWLDPLDLARGRLSRIAMGARRAVREDGLVGLAYGKLADHLEASHRVIRHDYDWRQPIRKLGADLARVLRDALQAHPGQPVRILAHSMGGLVARAAFAADKTLWRDIVARPGGRLLMLGTPNHGSHLFVETLLGQSDTIRTLARVDLKNGMQAVLDIVAGFPGAVHLLPAPGFEDTGGTAEKDYYRAEAWSELAEINNDFWFGRRLAGKPAQAALDEAAAFWREMADTRWVDLAPDRVAYVFGQADNTPCGILLQRQDGKPKSIMMRGTPHGDGSVTWKSGRIPNLPDERCWYMPADHMGLTSTGRHFGDIEALLDKGVPLRLGRLPVSRGEEARAPLLSYRAGPPPAYPGDAEIATRVLGGRFRPLPRLGRSTLSVAVRAMDLRFVQVPILCGHYEGDPIAGAEGVIDRWLVGGALSQRQRLGIHSGALGGATVVLMPRSRQERLRRTGRGAVVVGLGEMGRLGAEGVTEAVRAGALRYLLHACDRDGEEGGGMVDGEALPLRLASLLIGTNSTAQLDVGDAVKAIVLGVLLANRDFALCSGAGKAPRGRIVALELVELYRDAAISAAYAVSTLDKTLAGELGRFDTELELAAELQHGDGVRQRLTVSPFTDYWPRLAVGYADDDEAGAAAQAPGAAPRVLHAERLRFTYMGEKARAEVVVQQRQPALFEKLAAEALTGPNATRYVAGEHALGHMLFQLLVPVDFKAVARKANNLILVVDERTANLPWELLEADGEPLVRNTRMVRQFSTTRFRREVVHTDALNACVIANPSTEGYHAQFGGPDWRPRLDGDGKPRPDRLPSLDGAAREGEAVARILEGAGYVVKHSPPDSLASDVFAHLFARPCRILAIAAHGIYAKRGADGRYRSGVVLSDGLLLSATEIGLLETVPDLVFLSCCHLGRIGGGEAEAGQRLAASLARELIDMGVRCVVAAGWEVRDDAALSFAETFFNQMAVQGARFADAVFVARRAALDAHPDCNTWGAYQAYGDPAFQLKLDVRSARDDAPLLAPEELLDWLEQLRLDTRVPGAGRGERDFVALDKRVQRRLAHLPPHWAERTDVLQAIGRLYGSYGAAGFGAAQMALLRAVAEDSSQGVVPISTIEQLVNLEACRAEALSVPGEGQDLAAAAALIDDALARVSALVTLSGLHPASGGGADAGLRVNAERQSIIGSTWKRKAIVLLRNTAPELDAVREALRQARDAYAQGEGDAAAPGWNPYACINRLQLDAVLGETGAGGADATRCADAARARFGRSFDFWDAVMAADAVVAHWLAGGELPGEPRGRKLAAALSQDYRDTLDKVAASPRDLDSVFAQLRLLADFLRLRGSKADLERAKVLDEVLTVLGGTA
ncbi:CHAT domain-containing protein [Thauera linaloolentis]|uniref:Uncharacterized protein n=1 Tax=Thauera linaloolentis (strain DSM 12138 / JCM 21573 / CCUG 41526 / CIP 105981 / IAM 15112 / NBRC 102519 / 47Lol) TaxID=1123367 RepID=N6Z4V9_THAL4|nr:CHAT domain-containing protein [Thauera linaloolentis]ENO87204.1 hypothetical protein C666_11440 [Thauera linaloolentis 47Lol = DSM 12138]MCM8567357.1 CHAT domain-containing protein [Thauera linaloolentis]